MSVSLIPALAAFIPRDRVDSIAHASRPLTQDGVALIADISGFTPLTEALTQGLRPDEGAEELTRALDSVFTPLIAEIHAFRGSVIKFGGDALIVWFGREKQGRRTAVIRRALTAAQRMQQTIKIHGQVPTPIGPVTLKMKIGMAYGPIKRYSLGLAAYGYEDVVVGATLDRMAEAEHQSEPGDIMIDRSTLKWLPGAVSITEWRDEFGVVEAVIRPARPYPWSDLKWQTEREDELVRALSPYVPGPIYKTLIAGRSQVAELKPVVSLFIQFHGLDYDADSQVEEKLQTYFATAQQVVARYNGRLNRLITGDKGSLIHVIFGAPRSVEEQESRATRCALDLMAECGGLPFISMQRIGVTVGRVFAGPVGSPERHDYTTMGDSINLSARLMQNAADDQVLLETAVRQMLGSEFEVTDLGQIGVKGKSEPIPVFAAERVREGQRSTRPTRLPPIFGRERETAVIREKLANLALGKGHTAVIVGEVGLGKTLLLDTVQAESEASWRKHGTAGLWANGISLAYGQTISGYLFISLLRDLLALPSGSGPDQTSQELQRFCIELFGADRLESVYPYLAKFMGLPLSVEFARRLEGLAGESVRWQVFELVPELFRRLCSQRPVVLALDDVQWADPTSLELMARLEEMTADSPLLLLLAMRPGGSLREPTAANTRTLMTLTELARETAVDLLGYHAPHLPPHIVAHLVERGGGNPLYLVELVRTLSAQGLLNADVDLTNAALDSLDLPSSVQGLLLAQLDRLVTEARHTLQLASVIGKTFLHKVLAVIAGAGEQLNEQLNQLEARDFIQPADTADLGDAHEFRHGLIQESAYNTLLYERRRAYHRQVAETLERLFPTLVAEQSATLGHHYELAGDLNQAIYYLMHTADQARLLYAHEEAESLYNRVLDLLGKEDDPLQLENLDRRARTYLKLAQVRANLLDFEAAQQHYEQAFSLLEQLDVIRGKVDQGRTQEPPPFRWGILPDHTRNFDPALIESAEVAEVVNNLFEGLVELDDDWNIVPAAARRWQVFDGGTRYLFHLWPGQQWSDGILLTAHDFVFAWRRNLAPQTEAPMAYQLYIIQGAEDYNQGRELQATAVGIQAVDELTLEIRLKTPVTSFLYLLASHIAFPQPAHVVDELGAEWARPFHLVGNGAFVIDADQDEDTIRLNKNDLYRGISVGDLSTVELHLLEPGLGRYAADEIDWCRVDDSADLSAHPSDERFLVQGFSTFFLGFACQTPPFDDVLVRQAFSQAVDRRELVNAVWAGVQRPADGGFIPPGMPGHSPEISLPFDPIRACQLMATAGYPDGRDFPPLRLLSLPGFQSTPDFLKKSWQTHLHIPTIHVESDVSVENALAGLGDGSVHMVILGWFVTHPDPDDVLRGAFYTGTAPNVFGWNNGTFNQLLDQAELITGSPGRFDMYHKADRILVGEDTAVVPLYYLQAYGLMRSPFQLQESGKIIRDRNIKFKNITAV